jgi:hypothetical protein
MVGNRFLSILAGIISGVILGSWIYSLEGIYLAYGPFWESAGTYKPIPDALRYDFLIDCLKFGVIPGLIIGFIGGSTSPFLIPRGHMSKSMGCLLFLIITPIVWLTQWDNVHFMGTGKITMAVIITLMVFLMIIPVSGMLGEYVERLREIGLYEQKGKDQ